jgi:hypothetical protein
MKKLVTIILLGTVMMLPLESSAWVTYCRPAYRPPVYGGCWHGGWGCGSVSTGTAVAAGLGGLAVGAAIGAATRPPVVVAPAPIIVNPAPVIVNPAPVVIQPAVPIGSVVYTLPYGAQSANINGTQYYVANGVYYQPFFGSNGVYYQVVQNPI